MIMKQLLLVSASLVLVACNTTYSAPKEPAPALWQGKSGVTIVEPFYKTMPGIHEEYGVIAEIDADHLRKARLVGDVSYETTLFSGSDTIILPAGTPLYARQYTQTITTSGTYVKTSTVSQARHLNPIEWCAERPDNKGAVCIFWENSEEAFYLETIGSPVGPQVESNAGKRGVLPSIVEDSTVKFKNDLKVALQIGRLTKKYAYVYQKTGSYVDGRFKGATANYQRVKWDDNGEATVYIAGGKFLLTAIKDEGQSTPRAVNVSIITPPQLSELSRLSDADKEKLRQLFLKAGKKEN